MPSALKVRLSPQENQDLIELCLSSRVPKRTKKRALALRLLNRGFSVQEIGLDLNYAPQTVREIFYRWISQGLSGLFDKKRPGRPSKCKPEDLEFLEKSLDQEEKAYNSKQLAYKLHEERQVKLSPCQVRRLLKKKTKMETSQT